MAAVAPAAAMKPAAQGEAVNLWGLGGAIAALVAVLALPTPQGLPYAGQIMLGLLAFSVILWMTEAVDYAISAVLITALMAFLLGLAPNAAKPDTMLGTSAALGLALGGFANTALALVAAATFLSAAMTVTGLAQFKRHFPRLAPLIDFHEISTPLSQASFVLADHGAMYGLEMSVQRMGGDALRVRTPAPGLLLAGQDAGSPGIQGAFMGGFMAAASIEPRLWQHLAR